MLDVPKNLDMILDEIRGLGGTVLRTNVDVDRARLVQSTLSAVRPRRRWDERLSGGGPETEIALDQTDAC